MVDTELEGMSHWERVLVLYTCRDKTVVQFECLRSCGNDVWKSQYVSFHGCEAPYSLDGPVTRTTYDLFAVYGSINGMFYAATNQGGYATILLNAALQGGGKHVIRSTLHQLMSGR